eukprot:364809-Chlamydomonas_euryale.AAC.7
MVALDVRLEHHHQQRPLIPLGARNSNDGRLGDERMAHCQVLDLDGADPFASRFDHVLRPARRESKALLR